MTLKCDSKITSFAWTPKLARKAGTDWPDSVHMSDMRQSIYCKLSVFFLSRCTSKQTKCAFQCWSRQKVPFCALTLILSLLPSHFSLPNVNSSCYFPWVTSKSRTRQTNTIIEYNRSQRCLLPVPLFTRNPFTCSPTRWLGFSQPGTTLPPKGGRGFLRSPPCLEYQGCQFDPTFLFILLCFST